MQRAGEAHRGAGRIGCDYLAIVSAANERSYNAYLLDDCDTLDGCKEILHETWPEVLEQIHTNYFEPGADAVKTKYVRLQTG